MNTIMIIVTLVRCRGCDIFQLDVQFFFLHRELSENMYIKQRERYVKKMKEYKVYKLL